MTRHEDHLQHAIVNYIRTVAAEPVLVFAVPNATPRTMTAGTLRGAPDLLLFGPRNIVVAIEIKHGKGKTSEWQDAFAEAWRGFGHVYCVLRSIDEARLLLKAMHIKTREAFKTGDV